MTNQTSPRVFISHSHEDKERFVTQFATKLRENGIEAWIDKWEILPGDSFVDKIFNHGLARASAVVAVISANSVNSKWVKDELDVATVKRITGQCRLIPVIVDEVEVPESVRHLEWVKVGNLADYESELRRIVDAVFGHSAKPQIGSPPSYLADNAPHISSLNQQDSAVMRQLCNIALREKREWINIEELHATIKILGIDAHGTQESIEVLEHEGMVKGTWSNEGVVVVKITVHGFDRYARTFISEYDDLITQVCFYLVNSDGQADNVSMAKSLDANTLTVKFIIRILENQDYVKTTEYASGELSVHYISPALRRKISR